MRKGSSGKGMLREVGGRIASVGNRWEREKMDGWRGNAREGEREAEGKICQ